MMQLLCIKQAGFHQHFDYVQHAVCVREVLQMSCCMIYDYGRLSKQACDCQVLAMAAMHARLC